MKRPLSLVLIAAILALLAAYGAFLATGPGPLAFDKGASVALADYKGPSPTGVPAELVSADILTRGEYLARAGGCQSCHTAPGGKAFAGGRAFRTAFGTIYAPNITPDAKTGIGVWTDQDFLKAIHQGIGRGGRRLYPAFPYAAYALMTDQDALAIKAYLFSLTPVSNQAPRSRLIFPFNQRWIMGVWARLFDKDQRFRPDPARSADWNRGAYLAEALAHCGDCHTPRHALQAPDNRRKYKGGEAEGWNAYNITADRLTGVGAWSDAELEQYLSTGHAVGRGTASGPMAEAVDQGLSHLTTGDVHAIVVYLRSVPALASPDMPARRTFLAPASPHEGMKAIGDPEGRRIFEGACASCHGWDGTGTLTTYATLTGARAVNDPTAANVAQVVIEGSRRRTPGGEVFMPSFGAAYSDAEIAAVANYVTARYGARPSRLSAGEVARLRGK